MASAEQEAERSDTKLRNRAEHSLGSLVMMIEFTLISVMAGVVLAPLADHAKDLLRNMRFEFWPYILFGLLFILFMWSGVISHSFTFVGWPFELGHNLLYIVWALVLAMQMTFLQDPTGWFAMNSIQYLIAGWVGYYDLRILRRRTQGATGAMKALFEMALQRQSRLIRLFPLAFVSSSLSFILLLLFPGFFLERNAHWLLGVIQIFVVAGGLFYNARALINWQEPIVQKTMEELAKEE
jgi:hypothetical protein